MDVQHVELRFTNRLENLQIERATPRLIFFSSHHIVTCRAKREKDSSGASLQCFFRIIGERRGYGIHCDEEFFWIALASQGHASGPRESACRSPRTEDRFDEEGFFAYGIVDHR